MKKISVILPCYNVAPYVERAALSVLNQQYPNVEVIAVDDGSLDNTLKVLKKLQNKHPKQVKVIFQENQGYGTAVNAGLSVAAGEYVAILDPDDYVDNDYYAPLLATAEGLCADVVFYNSYFECRQGFRKRLVSIYQPKRFTGSLQLTKDEICHRLAFGNVGICFAIYKKSFLEDNYISLDNKARAYEDVSFIASVLNMSEKVAVMPGGGYYYNRDIPGQSVTNQNRFASILKITENFFNDRHIKPSKEPAIRGYFLKHLSVYWHKSSGNHELQSSILRLIEQISDGKKLLCEEWTYQFIQKQLPNLRFQKENLLPISPTVTPLQDLPPLHKVLNDGSYFQFMGFARYKLARMLEENAPTINIFNEVYPLLNTPGFQRSNIIKSFVKTLLEKEEFSSLFRINNAQTVKLMTAARTFDSIPDLSVYCDDAQFARLLAEDFHISQFPELENVSLLQVAYKFYDESNKNLADFKKYIKGKKIAVVGNSPCELNKRKGALIDSYDIVIRFNNFETNQDTKIDYGEKVSVKACTPTLESLKLKEEAGCIDFLLLPRANSFIPKFRLDYLTNLAQAGTKITMFDTEYFMRKYDMRIFSLGLLVVLWLAENRDLVDSISIFGFSLTDQLDGIKHYFSGDPSAGKQLSFHKWSKEALILNSLIQEGGIEQC
ncbi:MAG: glycosyltransferase family 29 protein [Neisseria sp.]|nr:glycosyltransferase family 29 protein [Neisseria sp.]